MRKVVFGGIIGLSLMMSACKDQAKNESVDMSNPLLSAPEMEFGVPAFHLIKNEHYEPAMEYALKVHSDEINEIAENQESPTFANTIEALENSGSLLNDISSIFFNVNSAHTNDTLQKISEVLAPKLSEHSDKIFMNAKLFERVKLIHSVKDDLGLDEDQLVLLDKTYKGFVRNGALLDETNQKRLSTINQELSLLTVKFSQNSLAEVNGYQLEVDKLEDLAGLPEEQIAGAAETAKAAGKEGKWIFTLQNPSIMPFLQYADNRALREKIWTAYKNRGNNGNANDNKENIKKLAELRREKAQLLGYKTHADYVLEEQMAKTPDRVNGLLNELWAPALKVASNEAAEIQKMIDAEGGNFKLAPYDWRYYAEKVRKAKFDLNEQDFKPYFSLEKVTEGVFDVTQKLFGLTFVRKDSLPTYHPEAVPYQVLNADGSHLGVLYMDFHPRASKRGGAWMTNYREQSTKDGKRVAPVISIVCNFSKPVGDVPALLTFDEVSTYFHEFGHALHGLLSDVRYRSQAGTNVPTDFVELPSQILENWAAEPEVLKSFAKHYKTGEVIPDALIQKLEKSGKYGQGFATVEYLASSFVDMAYHTQTAKFEEDPIAFEQKTLKDLGMIDQIIPRHSSTYFNHIFAGGYSAGYYSYIWSEVLDADAFDSFKKKGLFDKSTADAFKNNILSKGGTKDPMALYVAFKGAEPSTKPLLIRKGLASTGS